MLNKARKWELDDIFFHEDEDPENLTLEEQEYWSKLLAQRGRFCL